MSLIGVVIIARNEGDRLVTCLNSLQKYIFRGIPVIYVDSGSTDNSCNFVSSRNIEIVNLDLSLPFTAARARNAGFERLIEVCPEVQYVQFVDGDCEVVDGWIEAAYEQLDDNSLVAAVCGWRRERYPENSFFNRICNVEWHMGNLGETSNFGGDVMIRAKSFASVGGYNPKVIAAEDDELSVRLRQSEGIILRIDRDSTVHDANMHTIAQWWQRAKRCGYAYALVHSLHGSPPERKFAKEVKRTWIWGILIPGGALGLAWLTKGLSLLFFCRYPLTALRVGLTTWHRGFSLEDSIPWGISCGFSVFPESLGLIKYNLDRWLNKELRIIEYKGK
jgi:glycosyltransferase involved in cell wall biosynthesis